MYNSFTVNVWIKECAHKAVGRKGLIGEAASQNEKCKDISSCSITNNTFELTGGMPERYVYTYNIDV